MKYCTYCGAQLQDNASFCQQCGATLSNNKEYHNDASNPSSEQKYHSDVNRHVDALEYKRSETLGWVAIFVGFFLSPLVAFICGGIGLSKANATGNTKGRTLCIIGIVLGVVAAIINIIFFSLMMEIMRDIIDNQVW